MLIKQYDCFITRIVSFNQYLLNIRYFPMVENESDVDTEFGRYAFKVRFPNRNPKTCSQFTNELSEAHKPLKVNAMCYMLVCAFGRIRCLIVSKFSKGLDSPMRLQTTDFGLIKSIQSLKTFPVARNIF